MSWGGIRFVESIVIGAYFIELIPVNLCWLVPRHTAYRCVFQAFKIWVFSDFYTIFEQYKNIHFQLVFVLCFLHIITTHCKLPYPFLGRIPRLSNGVRTDIL